MLTLIKGLLCKYARFNVLFFFYRELTFQHVEKKITEFFCPNLWERHLSVILNYLILTLRLVSTKNQNRVFNIIFISFVCDYKIDIQQKTRF